MSGKIKKFSDLHAVFPGNVNGSKNDSLKVWRTSIKADKRQRPLKAKGAV